MNGNEVYEILAARGVTRLHHVNSVKTSLSLLKLGGLASRSLVERSQLPQTNQISDTEDRAYGIWGDVFVDTVDIHQRISDRNKYGPVLFIMNINVLRALPPTARVLVTRSNPTKWENTHSDAERYFLTAADLNNGLSIGDFDQMLVIRTTEEILPFMHYLEEIVVDEPKLTQGSSPEFSMATIALTNAVIALGLQVPVKRRLCISCNCINSYAEKASRIPWFFGVK
jgi:hypothetical protein